MAIIIPSKNIFEISNQKVVDNEVDNVEVTAKNASIISDTKIVYNEKISSNAKDDDKQSHYTHNEKTYSGMGTQSYTAIAYVEETPKYDTVTITIPKHIGNAGVLRVLTGVNSDGVENIKYSLRGTTKKGNVDGTCVCNSSVVSGVSFENIALNEPTNVETKTDTQYSFSPNVEFAIELHATATSEPTVSATEKFILNNKSNILTAQTRDSADGESFIIDLIFLSGTKIKKAGGAGLYILGGTIDINLSGEYEEYIPDQIDISFYGDTVSLDLQDETVKIGDGQHVYSFSGNELMQYNPSEERYGLQIRELVGTSADGFSYYKYSTYGIFKNLIAGDILRIDDTGEEAVAVYYDVDSVSTIVIKAQSNGAFANASMKESSLICTRISSEGFLNPYNNIIQDWQNGKEVAVLKCSIDNYYSDSDGSLVVSPYTSSYPMTIHIGDIVIPYIYGAEGEDKPMSLLSDKKTPKKFIVVGEGLIGDGGIWKEITIQEIKE